VIFVSRENKIKNINVLLYLLFAAFLVRRNIIMFFSTIVTSGFLATSALAAQLTRVSYPNNATSKAEMCVYIVN
jgi:uncharacterized membrane protein